MQINLNKVNQLKVAMTLTFALGLLIQGCAQTRSGSAGSSTNQASGACTTNKNLLKKINTQKIDVPSLFQEVDAQNRAKIKIQASESDQKALRQRYVKIDVSSLRTAFLQAKVGDHLTIPFFNDKMEDIIVEKVSQPADGNIVVTAKSGDDLLGDLTLVVKNDVVVAHMHKQFSNEHYEIQYKGNGVHAVRQSVEQTSQNDCLEVPTPESRASQDHELNYLYSYDANPIIDMLVAYTPQAAADQGGPDGIEALIQLGIADTNSAFKNSGVALSVRLVGMLSVSQNDTNNFSNDLVSLQGQTDGMWDAVHAERARLGADQVTMVGVYPNNDIAGIGYVGATYNFAFTVVKTSAFGQYTFSHELGHNIGLQHSDGLENPTGGFRTIMAYGTYPRIPRYSNPGLPYNNAETGDSTHNSAQILNANGKYTSNLAVMVVPLTADPVISDVSCSDLSSN